MGAMFDSLTYKERYFVAQLKSGEKVDHSWMSGDGQRVYEWVKANAGEEYEFKECM